MIQNSISIVNNIKFTFLFNIVIIIIKYNCLEKDLNNIILDLFNSLGGILFMMKILNKIFLLTMAVIIIVSATIVLAEDNTNSIERDESQVENINSFNRITLHDAWVAWENNEKFPVAFLEIVHSMAIKHQDGLKMK